MSSTILPELDARFVSGSSLQPHRKADFAYCRAMTQPPISNSTTTRLSTSITSAASPSPVGAGGANMGISARGRPLLASVASGGNGSSMPASTLSSSVTLLTPTSTLIRGTLPQSTAALSSVATVEAGSVNLKDEDDDEDEMIVRSDEGTSTPDSCYENFDDSDLLTNDAVTNDEVTRCLMAAGTVGLAAAAAIATGKKRKRPHSFETDPSVRRRQQTRLLRDLRATVDEYTTRIGQQAVVMIATPGKPTDNFKVFGAQPLENVIRDLFKGAVITELENALAAHAPSPGATINGSSSNAATTTLPGICGSLPPASGSTNLNGSTDNLHDLPRLVIDGIPTPVEKMTQAQLRCFIPLMLKYSTGRGKPGWGRETTRPPWWPHDLPWANVRSDVRSDEDKQRVSWTHALRQIVINCYRYHGREDLLPAFGDSASTPQPTVIHSASEVDDDYDNKATVIRPVHHNTVVETGELVTSRAPLHVVSHIVSPAATTGLISNVNEGGVITSHSTSESIHQQLSTAPLPAQIVTAQNSAPTLIQLGNETLVGPTAIYSSGNNVNLYNTAACAGVKVPSTPSTTTTTTATTSTATATMVHAINNPDGSVSIIQLEPGTTTLVTLADGTQAQLRAISAIPHSALSVGSANLIATGEGSTLTQVLAVDDAAASGSGGTAGSILVTTDTGAAIGVTPHIGSSQSTELNSSGTGSSSDGVAALEGAFAQNGQIILASGGTVVATNSSSSLNCVGTGAANSSNSGSTMGSSGMSAKGSFPVSGMVAIPVSMFPHHSGSNQPSHQTIVMHSATPPVVTAPNDDAAVASSDANSVSAGSTARMPVVALSQTHPITPSSLTIMERNEGVATNLVASGTDVTPTEDDIEIVTGPE